MPLHVPIRKSLYLLTCLGIVLAFGLIPTDVFAQSVKKMLRSASQSYRENRFGEALTLYLDVLASDPENVEANFYAGVCYLNTSYHRRALPYIRKAYQKDPAIHSDIEYLLGEAYQYNNEFNEAIASYQLHKQHYRGKDPKELPRVDRKIEECRNGLRYIQNPVRVVIKNFGEEVNSRFPDYAPVISSNESVMFFTSRREGSLGGFLAPEDGLPYEDIYVTFNVNGKWTPARNVGPSINTESHDACIAVSADGKQLFIYRDTNNGDIYASTLLDSVSYRWSTPESLGGNVNTKYQEPSVSMTADNQVIYFSSDRPGGMGGLDIYVSRRGRDGQWGEAVNLGAPINTPEDDDAPFIHPDGQTLYFSSRGHSTMGGYDIFKCYLENGKWTEPENLGFPINTADDNTYFVLSADNRHGYYASVYEEGLGEKDIYLLSMPLFDTLNQASGKDLKLRKGASEVNPGENPITILRGTIMDALTKEPLEAHIVLTDNEKDEVVSELMSTPETGKYVVNIPSGRNYGLAVEKKGYLFHSENYNVPPSIGYRELTLDVAMKRSTVGSRMILKNIFFDFDKALLRKESTAELQKVITLLKDEPGLKVRITGHTDNVGTDTYNQALSERRARAVVDYLISKGIPAQRLSARGDGADYPVATNDTEEGRQQNRRTEFEITGK
jgi:outer membrane protein OmpA-like peptidoglycan-associated protein